MEDTKNTEEVKDLVFEDGKSVEEDDHDDKDHEEEDHDRTDVHDGMLELRPAEASANEMVYIDGSYSASGSYAAPPGQETVSISLTLAGDVITSVTVTPSSANQTSMEYQNKFADGIASIVNGVKLEELGAVGRVNGSSLTGAGFSAAVNAIKAQAAS